MAANPLREIASIGHDIQKIKWDKLPTDLERIGVLFINTRAHLNEQSVKSCVKIAKLMKYMELEIYFIINPTVDDFVDIMRRFVTQVTDYLFCFYIGTKIQQALVDSPAVLKMKGGDVDPELLFDLLNSKKEESKVAFVTDGFNDPSKWDPSKNGVTRSGVIVLAPYPDPAQSKTEQFDTSMESFFALELNKTIKSNPEITGAELAQSLSTDLNIVGTKVYCASCPPEFKDQLSFAI